MKEESRIPRESRACTPLPAVGMVNIVAHGVRRLAGRKETKVWLRYLGYLL